MTHTGKIRASFERSLTTALTARTSYPSDEEIDILWFMFEKAYHQGQRDLIEDMGEPVAFQSPKKETRIMSATMFRVLKGAQQEQESWVPLYNLPEGVQK